MHMNDRSAIARMYEAHLVQKSQYMRMHRHCFCRFLSFIILVLGVSVAGAYHFRHTSWAIIPACVGPLLGAMLSLAAVQICNRSYRSFLEQVTIVVKLATVLGATRQKQDTNSEMQAVAFPDDTDIMPQRWLELHEKYASAAEFVDANIKGGSNRIVRWTFFCLAGVSALFFISIPALAL